MPYPFNYGYNTNGYYPQYGFNGYQQFQPTPQMPQQPMMQNAQKRRQKPRTKKMQKYPPTQRKRNWGPLLAL